MNDSPERTRIKICGITTPEMAVVVSEAGADFIGLVFAEGSPRRIRDFERAREILEAARGLDEPAKRPEPVGVFRNPEPDPAEDLENWKSTGSWIQIHGEFDESRLQALGRTHPVIRGFRFARKAVQCWDSTDGVTALLVDGTVGGGGASFDHAELARMMPEIMRPVFLAGGLTPENVGEAIRIVRPFAVDVSSGVESSRGVKDPARIRAFCAAVRAADAALRT